MTTLYSPEYRAKRESERIRSIADEAQRLAKSLDIEHYPNLHISKALRGIQDGTERDDLFRKVKAELRRRGFKTPQEQKRERDRQIEEARQQIMLEDAYKHEAQINPRERDDDDKTML